MCLCPVTDGDDMYGSYSLFIITVCSHFFFLILGFSCFSISNSSQYPMPYSFVHKWLLNTCKAKA